MADPYAVLILERRIDGCIDRQDRDADIIQLQNKHANGDIVWSASAFVDDAPDRAFRPLKVRITYLLYIDNLLIR